MSSECIENSLQCDGCIASNDKPFHGKCSIIQCVGSKGKRHCGECEGFPCETITRYCFEIDHRDNAVKIERCRAIETAFARAAQVGKSSIGYCGHHCDFCFLAQWCGGCRSGYNCCSYATLHEDNICPNVGCAKEKNLQGCYECNDLMYCAKGYYERSDEYVAKATALFIKKYGEDRYTSTLKRAIDSGVDYPKSFDSSGSVTNALILLEGYL